MIIKDDKPVGRILATTDASGVTTITIDSRSRANALSLQMLRDLGAAWDAFEDDPDARVAIITGAGDRHFCGGADRELLSSGGMAEGEALRMSSRLCGVTKPVIAVVNGHAVGGGLGILADADIVLASSRAEFFDPHVSLGLVVAYATLRVAAELPPKEGMLLGLGGRTAGLTAARAHMLGLVQELYDDEATLRERGLELATAIAALPDTVRAESTRLLRVVTRRDDGSVAEEGLELTLQGIRDNAR